MMSGIIEERFSAEELRFADRALNPVKTLIFIEGPSGCGKTFLTKMLELVGGSEVIRSSLNKRRFEKSEAAEKSMANDYLKLTKAFNSPASLVFVERFMVSQFVYGAIRQGLKDQLMPGDISTLTHNLIRTAYSEHLWRHNLSLEHNPVQYAWIFLVPRPEVLKERRKWGSKGYPHDLEIERRLYKHSAFQLASGNHLTCLPPYGSEEDAQSLYHHFLVDWGCWGDNIDGFLTSYGKKIKVEAPK